MKKLLVAVLLLWFGISFADEILQDQLPNGMEIVVKENTQNESVGFYCFVKTGSVNEGKYLGAGISHFLEHVVSSGTTEHRTEDEYQQLGKEMGAIINAYTNQFATAYHITVDKKFQDQALEILSEQMQSCVCDSFEVAREKEVILKEIVMRSTPPDAKVRQRHSELVYPNSNKRYPVIGYTELFKTITREELQDYYKKRYSPNNMIFVVVGNFEAAAMLKKVKMEFQDFPRRQLEPAYQPMQYQRAGSLEFIEEFEIKQPEVHITTLLPQEDFTDIEVLSAALNILFGKRKSPIRYKLVEELELVTHIYGYIYRRGNSPEAEMNIFFIPKNSQDVKKIVQIIDEEIEKFAEAGITEKQLQNYINRFKASELLHTPSVSNDANSIGWNMLTYGKPEIFGENLKILENATVSDLEYQLQKHLVPKNRVVFYALPEGDKALLDQTEQKIVEKSEITKTELKKDLTLIHKKSTEKPVVKGVIFFPLSTEFENSENIGSLSFMIDLMLQGSKNYESMDISEWLEDHAVSLYTRCNQHGTFIQFKCLKDDYSHLKKIIFDAIENPAFDEKELQLAKEKETTYFNRGQGRGSTHHRNFVNKKLYPNKKFSLSQKEIYDLKMELTSDDLHKLHQKFLKAPKLIVTLFGDLSKDKAESFAQEIYKNFPIKNISAEKNIVQPLIQDSTFVNEYDFEEVNINLYCPAPVLNDPDFKSMNLISTLLSGYRGRLHEVTRGENDLAYYAFPHYHYNENSAKFYLTSQTSLDRKDELIQVLKNELEKLRTELVAEEELNLAIQELENMLKTSVNDNSLPYFTTHYEALGLGYDYLDNLKKYYSDVTPEDIQQVAQKYFQDITVIVSQPNKDVEMMVK